MQAKSNLTISLRAMELAAESNKITNNAFITEQRAWLSVDDPQAETWNSLIIRAT